MIAVLGVAFIGARVVLAPYLVDSPSRLTLASSTWRYSPDHSDRLLRVARS